MLLIDLSAKPSMLLKVKVGRTSRFVRIFISVWILSRRRLWKPFLLAKYRTHFTRSYLRSVVLYVFSFSLISFIPLSLRHSFPFSQRSRYPTVQWKWPPIDHGGRSVISSSFLICDQPPAVCSSPSPVPISFPYIKIPPPLIHEIHHTKFTHASASLFSPLAAPNYLHHASHTHLYKNGGTFNSLLVHDCSTIFP